MGDLQKFVGLMRYWCSPAANLGYDQSNRWDVRVGGETDCSALVITVARKAGFVTGGATYTGNMSVGFTANGWTRLSPNVAKLPGDILLNDANHVAVYLGNGQLAQASIDERGRIAGGQVGNQTGRETNVRSYYDYPWRAVLRWQGGGKSIPVVIPGSTQWNVDGYDEAYVREVQTLLKKRGFDLEVDGSLGPITFAAIKDFQAKHGLKVDGRPGPETLGTLRTGTSPLARAGITRTDGQLLLDVDGDPGPATYSRFQQVMGTTIDGIKSEPSQMVEAFQHWLNQSVDPRHIWNLTGDEQLAVDGYDGYKTWRVFQYWVWCNRPDLVEHYAPGYDLGAWCDGNPGPLTWKVLQHCLNESYTGKGGLL